MDPTNTFLITRLVYVMRQKYVKSSSSLQQNISG